MFHIVVALDQNRGIGTGGRLPWRLQKDMSFFKKLTASPQPDVVEKEFKIQTLEAIKPAPINTAPNSVIMGRKTWDSLHVKFKPLPGRHNIVLTRGSLKSSSEFTAAASLDEALKNAAENRSPHTYVIGGAQIYEQALLHPDCRSIYMTVVFDTFDCDVFFPKYSEMFEGEKSSPVFEEEDLQFCFKVFEKKNMGLSG